jgi:hypothetical protein
MDRNQTESNPIKPVETAGRNQKGAFGLERGCVQSTSRSTWKSPAASGVFQQAGFAKLLRLVPLCGTQPRSGVSARMRPIKTEAGIHFTRRVSGVSSRS